MNITESELKNHLDQYLDMAETAPVIVEKTGKIRLAIISYPVYEYLKKYWPPKQSNGNIAGYPDFAKRAEAIFGNSPKTSASACVVENREERF